MYGVELVRVDDTTVSSSQIRAFLRSGDLAQARALLGRHYDLTGAVEGGSARGRTLGFPTANVCIADRLLPPHGVYAVYATLPSGERRHGVANLGARPTFGQNTPTLEVHLLDWTGDLYGQPLRVAFASKLRDERAFSSSDALRDQIADDIACARATLR